MQSIKVNGIEIEFDDSLDVSIEDGGKKITVRGKQQPLQTIHVMPQPIPVIVPYQPPAYPHTPTWPTYPIVTCQAPTLGDNCVLTTGVN